MSPPGPWRLGEKDETEEFLPLPERDASVYGVVVAERVHPVNYQAIRAPAT